MNTPRIHVHGIGVVSPAGWGIEPFQQVLDGHRLPDRSELPLPDGSQTPVLRVPTRVHRPPWMGHPRMRRTSAISQFAMSAAIEALGFGGLPQSCPGVAILTSVMGGGVNYSRRFFGEVLADPSTASPMLFPETVFNAPSSHLAAVLQTRARNDTEVGDETGFLASLAVAARWLADGAVPACLVVCCEELDWPNARAIGLFPGNGVPSEGAAALLLRREPSAVELVAVSSPHRCSHRRATPTDLESLRQELQVANALTTRFVGTGLSDPVHGLEPRLGEGLAATGGWACVAAADAVLRGQVQESMAVVGGSNGRALGCRFRATGNQAGTIMAA